MTTRRALTPHALGELRALSRGPVASQLFNPGVADKFRREGLAVEVQAPSPFAKHKGAKIAHLQITDEGRKLLRELEK